jgi:hypothetical protein
MAVVGKSEDWGHFGYVGVAGRVIINKSLLRV